MRSHLNRFCSKTLYPSCCPIPAKKNSLVVLPISYPTYLITSCNFKALERLAHVILHCIIDTPGPAPASHPLLHTRNITTCGWMSFLCCICTGAGVFSPMALHQKDTLAISLWLFSPVVALHSTGALGSHGGIHLRYLDWPCTSPHQPSPVAAGACNIISRLALHNWPKLDSQISDTDRA